MDPILNAARGGHLKIFNLSQDDIYLYQLKEMIERNRNVFIPLEYFFSELEKAVRYDFPNSVEFLVRYISLYVNRTGGIPKNILNIALKNGNQEIIDNLLPIGDANDIRMLTNWIEVEDSLEKYNKRKNKQRLAKDIVYKYMDQGLDSNEEMQRRINKYLGFGSKRLRKRSRIF